MERATEKLWGVSIQGPDDLLAAHSYENALRVANAFNAWWTARITVTGLHKFDPRMWAVPIEWPYDAKAHAASLDSPPVDYQTFILTAALSTAQETGGEDG